MHYHSLHIAVFVFAVFGTLVVNAQSPRQSLAEIDNYEPGPDSKPQPGVPEGKTFSFKFETSKVFPGTSRTITVYVPAQYKGDKPACVYVGLDALGFGVPVVFDNLIHKGEMPVTIAIGVSPGTVASMNEKENPRFNRSLEFDSLNDSLARCITEEIFPEIEKLKTPDGLPIRLSTDPNDRCAGGGSTGGIAAFTLAWERPDLFRRVFSAIGTFVGMRGGDAYPVLVRKTEPKPLRIFQQDGENDQWGGGPEVGDWWMSNQTLERALEFAGYEHQHIWGTGTHSGRHATAIFPDAMRFLWRDWPKPLKAGESQNTFLKAILEPGEGWKLAKVEQGSLWDTLAANPQGEIFFNGGEASELFKIGLDGKVYAATAREGKVTRMEFDSHGKRIATDESKGTEKTHHLTLLTKMAFGADGTCFIQRVSAIANYSIDRLLNASKRSRELPDASKAAPLSFVELGPSPSSFAITNTGSIYGVDSHGDSRSGSRLWLIRPHGDKIEIGSIPNGASGIALSPDGLWLAVMFRDSHWGYICKIKADGTVENPQRFYWLHVPVDSGTPDTGNICFDRDGRLYVATNMGIQVLDRNGRVRAILPIPGNQAVSNVCFGGENFDTLYVISRGKLYQRKMHVSGAPPFHAPIKLPPSSAG